MRPIISYFSHNQFITALLIISIAWFLIEIKAILMVLFVSFILMTAIMPIVHYLNKKGLPHILSVSITYLVLIAGIILLILPLAPFFTHQIQSLINNFPTIFENATKAIGVKIDYSNVNSTISNFLQSIGQNIILITGRIFGGILSIFTVLVVSFYLLIYHDRFEKLFISLSPSEMRDQVREVFKNIEIMMGHWARGQLTLSFFITIITWIFLTLIGVEYALPLAFLAGLLEIVPTIGPIIASIPAILVALTVSPALALAVAVGYIVIQAIENNILVPKVMQAAVGLNPVVIIMAILVGGSLLGIWGALLSIPFLTILTIIFRSISEK